MKHLYFAVTNDLNFDQRMHRICSTLAANGYTVTLVGRKRKGSEPLSEKPFFQHRLTCLFEKGFFFYAEYNIRLFLYLLAKKMDGICAIDLDTILPCYAVSRIKHCKRIYDAHELFCEMKEVKTRPHIYKIWKWIERRTVPRFPKGYTVNHPIQQIFRQAYGVTYEVIRNMPLLKSSQSTAVSERYIIYQGAVNEGRSFETLIPAFRDIDCPLWVFGIGNFFEQAKSLVQQYKLQQKIFFKGVVLPQQLLPYTQGAVLGVNLIENNGLNNYYSLANRFFDYIHAGIPQLCVGYPAYEELNDKYNIAVLTDDLSPESIARSINQLLQDKTKMAQLRQNCLQAREELNWQQEEKVLLHFYRNLFSGG